MTSTQLAEFATELLLPFTEPEIQNAANPSEMSLAIDRIKFTLEADIEQYDAAL